MSRSLPLLQFVLAGGLLIVSQSAFRAWRLYRQEGRTLKLFEDAAPDAHVNVVIVGVTALAEAYLRAVDEFGAASRLRVVGLLGHRPRHAGRTAVGRAEDLRDILATLDVHGAGVDRVVVACRASDLFAAARRELFDLEGVVDIQVLDAWLDVARGAPPDGARFAIPEALRVANRRRLYWPVKRLLDVVGACVGLAVLGPVLAVAAVPLACSVGLPVLFWQQRPGLGGRPFRLYKLRTMRPAHDHSGRLLTDAERTSGVGTFIRRTHLDEVPQLVNVLAGNMSFIGPRPLLPRDQVACDRARLLVRPGLTGWAQVTGGRAISAGDKAALDVWYIQNATFALDVSIAVRTAGIVLFGERVDHAAIARVWENLNSTGTVASGRAVKLQELDV